MKELKPLVEKIDELRAALLELYESQPDSWYGGAEAEDTRYAMDRMSDATERLAKWF